MRSFPFIFPFMINLLLKFLIGRGSLGVWGTSGWWLHDTTKTQSSVVVIYSKRYAHHPWIMGPRLSANKRYMLEDHTFPYNGSRNTLTCQPLGGVVKMIVKRPSTEFWRRWVSITLWYAIVCPPPFSSTLDHRGLSQLPPWRVASSGRWTVPNKSKTLPPCYPRPRSICPSNCIGHGLRRYVLRSLYIIIISQLRDSFAI